MEAALVALAIAAVGWWTRSRPRDVRLAVVPAPSRRRRREVSR